MFSVEVQRDPGRRQTKERRTEERNVKVFITDRRKGIVGDWQGGSRVEGGWGERKCTEMYVLTEILMTYVKHRR